jgi:hypothetical protein
MPVLDACQGYCTNVHPGTTLPAIYENLARVSVPVQQQRTNGLPLGVGLWICEAATAAGDRHWQELAVWLSRHHLLPYTLNGFPQQDFHQPVVKHRVYQPPWWSPERLSYTLRLIEILDLLLPAGAVGSISTLPLGWPAGGSANIQALRHPAEELQRAAEQLQQVAAVLERLENERGRRIVLAIEPEPGCILGDCAQLRWFYDRYLSSGVSGDRNRRYLGVCFDICHAAVMREDPARELQALKELGIPLGKVQVSSAIAIDWDLLDGQQRLEAFEQLSTFAEDRYLHQTSLRAGPVHSVRLLEDLPEALASVPEPRQLRGSWRVHFHVPIFCERLGVLQTTQSEIRQTLRYLRQPHADWFTGHWEVETYAWGVLPPGAVPMELPEAIGRELAWLDKALSSGCDDTGSVAAGR